jgi:hypothetical protein
MKFTVKDQQNKTLYIGSRQEVMHYIKREKLNRQEITLQKFSNDPVPHYTIPVTADKAPPKPWFKRIFD